MSDSLALLVRLLRLLAGTLVAVAAYGFLSAGQNFVALILLGAGLAIGLPGSFPLVVAACFLAVYLPFGVFAMWQIDQFLAGEEISLSAWGADQLRLLPWLFVIAVFAWFWRSGDPFRNRKL